MTQNNAAPFKAVLEATHIDIAINKKTIIHDRHIGLLQGPGNVLCIVLIPAP